MDLRQIEVGLNPIGFKLYEWEILSEDADRRVLSYYRVDLTTDQSKDDSMEKLREWVYRSKFPWTGGWLFYVRFDVGATMVSRSLDFQCTRYLDGFLSVRGLNIPGRTVAD